MAVRLVSTSRTGRRWPIISDAYIGLLGLVAFVAGWAAVTRTTAISTSTLPTPAAVAKSLGSMWRDGSLSSDILASLIRVSGGFAIAVGAAIVVGAAAARYARLYAVVRSTMALLSSIPPIAWTPLAILWFGIGNAPAFFIVFLGAFFPMFTSFYKGITSIDETLIEAAEILGASRSRILHAVILPASLPDVFAGLRTGLIVAWFNVIAAELVGVRSGLGYRIQLNRTLLYSEGVVAVMVVIGVLGFAMSRSLGIVANLTTAWSLPDSERAWWLRIRKRLGRLVRTVATDTLETGPATATPTSIATTVHEPVLEVRNVTKSFDLDGQPQALTVLDGISFSIMRHEIVCVIGPNGSGKTTLLRIVAGVMTSDSGEVLFEGRYVEGTDVRKTLVFQDFALFPWLTCRENAAFGIAHLDSDDRVRRVDTLLRDAGLWDFRDAYPADLSQGMRQRLAIARALAPSPSLLLMDEPFASLDPLVRARSQTVILDLMSARSTTVLLVTHDLDEAIAMADRIIVLTGRPTKVVTSIAVPPSAKRDRNGTQFLTLRAQLWDLLGGTPSVTPTKRRSSL